MPNGFGPRIRAQRLLRQSVGLMPPSDVRPKTGLAPAVEAALNMQLATGLITKRQFQKATGAPVSQPVGGVAPGPKRTVPARFFGSARQQPIRRVRRRRPQQPLPPISVPSIPGRSRGMPTDDMRRRLAEMRQRLTRGL